MADRPRGMNNRVAVWAAGMAFAVLVGGLAVVASQAGDDNAALPRLPRLSASQGASGEARSMAAADSAMPAIGYARVEYRLADGLDQPAKKATAYRMGAASEADAAALAKALGMTGTPKAEERGWVLYDADNYLQIDQRTGTWSYGASPNKPMEMPAIASCAPCPPDRLCAQGCEKPERPADLPGNADTERIAREFWKRIGVDPGNAAVTVDDGYFQMTARFRPSLDGTEIIFGDVVVGVGPKGVISFANGTLHRAERLGEYPLVSLAEAVARLNNPVASDGGREPARDLGGTAVTPDSGSTSSGGTSSSGSATASASATASSDEPQAYPAPTARPTPDPAQPTSGSGGGSEPGSGGGDYPTKPPAPTEPAPPSGIHPEPVPYPEPPVSTEPQVITLTSVRLALLPFDGHLVPVYVFTMDNGGETGPVPAVPDRYLSTQPAGTPAPAPAPAP